MRRLLQWFIQLLHPNDFPLRHVLLFLMEKQVDGPNKKMLTTDTETFGKQFVWCSFQTKIQVNGPTLFQKSTVRLFCPILLFIVCCCFCFSRFSRSVVLFICCFLFEFPPVRSLRTFQTDLGFISQKIEDSSYVIDRHPDYENVIIACGFGGLLNPKKLFYTFFLYRPNFRLPTSKQSIFMCWRFYLIILLKTRLFHAGCLSRGLFF